MRNPRRERETEELAAKQEAEQAERKAARTRLSQPQPPQHGGDEVLVKLHEDEPDAVRVATGDGTYVWLFPDEHGWIAKHEARALDKAKRLGNVK